jgi:phage shock protein C
MEQKMKILDQHNLFTRSDTIFGVCEGLGEDLRIPANLLRLSLAFLLFLNPPAAIATYIGAGLLVALSRWLYPAPAAAPAASVEAEPERTLAEQDEPMPLAA